MSQRPDQFRAHLGCEQLEARETPSTTAWKSFNFDSDPVGALPAGWQQWSRTGASSFSVSASRAQTTPNSLTSTGTSATTARAWYAQPAQPDFGLSAYVYLDSLQPVQLLVRGRDLDTATPTFYSLSLHRGLQAEISKTVAGQRTVLGSLRSTGYFSGQWVRATIQPDGNNFSVEIFRTDTQQYLNAAGSWQSGAASALQVADSSITGPGFAGVDRPAAYSGTVAIDNVSILGEGHRDNFDGSPAGSAPSGWAQWNNASSALFQTASRAAHSPANSLVSNSTVSQSLSRAWRETALGADVQVSSYVYLDSLVPAEVFARGQNLGTSSATYYALTITRGLDAKLLKVVDGTVTELGVVRSKSYISNQWVRTVLTVVGDTLHAQILRADTGQYLDSNGEWKNTSVRAMELRDRSISGGGFVGLSRSKSYSGTVTFDDFDAVSFTGDSAGPQVAITAPENGQRLEGVVTVSATATDASGVERVEFYIDGTLRQSVSNAPFTWTFDSFGLSNGAHTIMAKAYDPAGNVGSATINVDVENDRPERPTIPRHYEHIRIASLAYTGTPFSSYEDDLLRNSVDLVIPNPRYLSRIEGVSPNTPQLIYSNVSNLYLDLLTDWLNYADANGVSRESAFYHAAKATAWTGDSASSQPVTWFWSVRAGASLSALTNLTYAAHTTTTNDVPFGALGESIYLGFPDRFREINVNLSRVAAGGWQGVWEYAATVDASGAPTSWKTLSVQSDGTARFSRSGSIFFDPPPDWSTSQLPGAARMYYVRLRTTAGGTAPIATTLLGRDYVAAGGRRSGTIPAFDSAADKNQDGYLTDLEYSTRAAGKDARFQHESRLFYPYYGQMRFVTNPSGIPIHQWAADYHQRFLSANPLADGLFLDNSGGRSPLNGIATVEGTTNYSDDFGTLLGAIGRGISPRWIAANTSGGGAETDSVIRNTPASVEEFALRPLAHNRQQFEDMAALIARRQALSTPPAYMILDSHPTGGSPTDGRTQIATLAYYYLVGDPESTFLMFYGGYSPASSWRQHWSPAAAYDIGEPTATWSTFAQGTDPSNSRLTYKVYQRSYSNALVLYKPLSYAMGVGTGTLSDATATTHVLSGSYRILNADGTLSAPVTRVTLRNGEGAVLIKA